VKSLRSYAALVFVAGCAQLPSVTFTTAGDDAGSHVPPSTAYDATIPSTDSGGAVKGSDAGGNMGEDSGEDTSEDAGFDSEVYIDPTDDGGDAGPVMCGSTLVASCAQCSSAPLRCTKKGERDVCVADCSSCAENWFPCIHCGGAGDSSPRGTCVAVGANGQVACTSVNLCACTTAASCPVIEGGAETCDLVSGKMRCLTCGSPSTNGASCETDDGGTGTCQIEAGSLPTCR
jgi:hypothetical protein